MSIKRKLRTLLIEDSESDAELLILTLEKAGYVPEWERVCTAEKLQDALREKTWDIIFSDHNMPEFNSLAALEIRNKSGLDIPFIILSGTIGEDVAVEAMRAGASDYMVKGKAARLIPAVDRELQEAEDRELRRKTEEELQYFVASLTHDLRTPLIAELRIFEFFEKQMNGTLDEQQHKLIKELIRSNQFMQYMVDNILSAYKYKQHRINLNLESMDLNHLLRNFTETVTIQSLLMEKNQQLSLKLASTICPVSIDCNEMQRVLLNLIKNAINFSPYTSEIMISTEIMPTVIRMNIQDTGPGVDAAIVPHLFMPYATSSVKKYRHVGTGLGLYLSKQIIETHGGTIHFENLPGQGALFYFELPIDTISSC
jgi:signal transduction histidine kinase